MLNFLSKWFGKRKTEVVKDTETVNPVFELDELKKLVELKEKQKNPEKPVLKFDGKILYNLEAEKAVKEGDYISDKEGNNRLILGITKGKMGIQLICEDTEVYLFKFPNLKLVEVNDSDI